MKMIWWCEEHEASGWGGGKGRFCHLHPFRDEDHEDCKMVLMDLSPVTETSPESQGSEK